MNHDDHRSIGQRLDLFHMEEEAPGMVFWRPRGWQLYRAFEELVRRHMRRQGLREVRSPQLMRQPVWEASGHWGAFADGMFQLVEDHPAALKPVSCPAHLMMARRAALSHHDLPYRLGELGLVHRNEQSGALHGLFRLRQFVQDDGHILCSEEQVVAEVQRFCASLDELYGSLGFGAPMVKFAGRPDKRLGSDALWDRAEALLRRAADAAELRLEPEPGEGAFYGPKLEFVLHDRLGRAWQLGTIQLDMVLSERFGVRYVAPSGARAHPVVLHRAVLGSLERFIGVYLEHVAGKLPPWLAPEQVLVAPVGAAHAAAAAQLASALDRAGVRARLAAEGDRLSRSVAVAHEAAIPFVAVIGDRELAAGSVSLRSEGHSRASPRDAAIAALRDACAPPPLAG